MVDGSKMELRDGAGESGRRPRKRPTPNAQRPTSNLNARKSETRNRRLRRERKKERSRCASSVKAGANRFRRQVFTGRLWGVAYMLYGLVKREKSAVRKAPINKSGVISQARGPAYAKPPSQ